MHVQKLLGFVLAIGMTSSVLGQSPTASTEHEILKLEEGTWDATMTMFMGPAGPYDPPQKSKGKETNRMLGDFWLVSDFSGRFDGEPFEGRGQFGYDAEEKKYVGTWIDSTMPSAMKMEGTYDAETKTMTYETEGRGMEGNPYKGRNVVVYGKDERVMTMYAAAPGTDEMVKVMEVVYTKAN